eukprot:647848-Amphidinium_carterae.2
MAGHISIVYLILMAFTTASTILGTVHIYSMYRRHQTDKGHVSRVSSHEMSHFRDMLISFGVCKPNPSYRHQHPYTGHTANQLEDTLNQLLKGCRKLRTIKSKLSDSAPCAGLPTTYDLMWDQNRQSSGWHGRRLAAPICLDLFDLVYNSCAANLAP